MFSKKHLVLALVMNGVLGMTTACVADVVDCHNAANQNREECVRVKVNINHHDDKVDCNNAANRSECRHQKPTSIIAMMLLIAATRRVAIRMSVCALKVTTTINVTVFCLNVTSLQRNSHLERIGFRLINTPG